MRFRAQCNALSGLTWDAVPQIAPHGANFGERSGEAWFLNMVKTKWIEVGGRTIRNKAMEVRLGLPTGRNNSSGEIQERCAVFFDRILVWPNWVAFRDPVRAGRGSPYATASPEASPHTAIRLAAA